MSLKFNYNSTDYIFIPVTRTASTTIDEELQMTHTVYDNYNAELADRTSNYPSTWRHITYAEVQAMTNYNGTESFFSVVRHPMDRCVSLYNYLRDKGWLADYNFNTYWTYVINTTNESILSGYASYANTSPGARGNALQSDIVKTDGTIYKFETDLSQLESDFGITLNPENAAPNVADADDIEAVRSLIESHFDADYTTFGYAKG